MFSSPVPGSRIAALALGACALILVLSVFQSAIWSAVLAMIAIGGVLLALRSHRREKLTWLVRERQLKESTGHADEIIAAIPSGLIGLDANGVVCRWNDGATNILGVGRDDVIGTRMDVWPVMGQQGLAELLSEALQGRVVRRGNLEVARSDGKIIPLGISTSRLGEPYSAEGGAVAVFQDLTEVNKIRLQMKQQERLAAIGTLAASIAHEIRNPLASIAGSVEMLSQELDLAGEMSELLDLILRESDRLNTIISNFLEYTSEQKPRLALTAPRDLLRDVFRAIEMRPEAEAGLSLELTMNDGPDQMEADPDLLKQVFLNLILNACQAIKWRGEVRVDVEEVIEDEHSWSHFTISDTGPGIPPESQAQLFDPFFTTKVKGTGLGLAIAHRFAEMHGGILELVNEGNGGAQFRLRIPTYSTARAKEITTAELTLDEVAVQ